MYYKLINKNIISSEEYGQIYNLIKDNIFEMTTLLQRQALSMCDFFVFRSINNEIVGCLAFITFIDAGITSQDILDLRAQQNKKTKEHIYVMAFAVDQQYRRLGIGKKLMEMLLEKYSCDYDIYLHTSVNNFKAISLYNKMQFVTVNTTTNYFSDKGVEPYTGLGCNAYLMVYEKCE